MAIVTEAITKLPSRYQENVQCEFLEYKPVLTAGEHYANMLNTEELFDVSLINDFKLAILDARGNIVADDIAIFVAYDTDGLGNGRISWDIIAFPLLKEGDVRIVIYESVENKISFASNLHEVINDTKVLENRTAYFKYRHSTNIYRFGYVTQPDFFIRERLHINTTNEEQVFDVEEYKEVSTGISRNPRFDVDQVIEFETENYDGEAHKGFAVLLAHQTKEINNKVYELQNGASYSPSDKNINSTVWNARISLVLQSFSTINKQ